MHSVEVRRGGSDLAAPMAQMRTWLDGKGIEPSLFRMSLIPGGTVFTVEFKDARAAAAFARALGGKMTPKRGDQPLAA